MQKIGVMPSISRILDRGIVLSPHPNLPQRLHRFAQIDIAMFESAPHPAPNLDNQLTNQGSVSPTQARSHAIVIRLILGKQHIFRQTA